MTEPMSARGASVPARLVMLPVRGWRVVSTRLPPRCRFHPSCSAYALEALTVHGAARGSWLAARRVGRCHPWNPGGLDPVPPRSNVRSPRSPAATA
ncbi:MAG: membrane protein insertion efficiency factor YidD [Actinobacteria bacterium]|nr:membrane protein insertion efficiency factor YidD [Actinomycetota bacterium]